MKSEAIDTDDRPLVVTWESTRAGGVGSANCRRNPTEQPHPEELTTQEAKRLLDSLREFGKGLLVVFSGGDPLERDDLFELVEYGNGIGLTVALDASLSGGISLDCLERLSEAGLYRLAVGLEGATAEGHDAVRSAPGSFEAAVETLEAAREVGLPAGVNTVVSRETFEELPAIRDRIEELDIVLWNLFFVIPASDCTLENVDPSTADAIMRWLHEASNVSPFDVRTIEAPQYRRVAIQRGEIVTGVRDQFGTYAGDGIVHVDHVGNVQPSELFRKSVDNVRERSIVETYREASLFRQLRDRSNLEGRCGACPYRDICGGSRARAYAETGNPFATDELCPFEPPGFGEG
ncbi:radical SAM protein [Halalkaliarchaeum desulfuricum]|uniref:Radical SAM protein n=1 Tax=Halalkaliarchaeum desulfuricum TaxID=2055893 RepID=A0A343THT4_9EURY|nr:radical SAM protein [Halalkaliarchaeum desulfuricum]AUX08656.1 radical SAM protein [Halalkaliarchaeum desulfuricum]